MIKQMKLYLGMIFVLCLGIYVPINAAGHANTFEQIWENASSGMLVQKLKMGVLAENVANVSTFKVEETDKVYTKKVAVIGQNEHGGATLKEVVTDTRNILSYSDAAVPQSRNSTGFMDLPNVDLSSEMVDLRFNELMYEANVTCLKTIRNLYQSTVEALK